VPILRCITTKPSVVIITNFSPPDLRNKTEVKLNLESALQKAVSEETLDLNYQPIFDIKNKKVAGIETLMRWNHPELGNTSPATFIPIMEETGLIGQTGEWVLKTACQQLKLLHDQGLVDPDCSIAVNFSARQFKDFETVEMIKKILKDSELSSHLLDIYPCYLKMTDSAGV
jgi:EAL domain-containing protein (putative c-di-GMP-specific phosphodiesterase class I)